MQKSQVTMEEGTDVEHLVFLVCRSLYWCQYRTGSPVVSGRVFHTEVGGCEDAKLCIHQTPLDKVEWVHHP